MKKKIFCLLLMLVVLSLIPFSASADSYDYKDWYVTFTSGQKLNSNFDTASIDDLVNGLQPGDTLNIRVRLKNEYSKTVDWYMKNEVVRSLETSTAQDGGYTYVLNYTHPNGSVDELYSSDRVGGEREAGSSVPEGLKEATANLKDYFFLDSIATGQSGYVDLTVMLDGETQGNNYQTKSADLTMRFAVEVPDTTKRTIVKTGDEYNLFPFYIAMAVSGLVFLYLALDSITDRIYFGKKG